MSLQEGKTDQDQAFVRLLTEHQNLIRNFIISLLPGAPGVDDVIQNTNVILWEKRSDFAPGTNFRAWAFTIGRFQTMAHLKDLRRKGWLILDPDIAEQLADEASEALPLEISHEAQLAALDECMAGIRKTDRELLVHRYWHQTPLRDLAKSVKRSENALKVTLHRLRTALKRCVQERLATLTDPKPS